MPTYRNDGLVDIAVDGIYFTPGQIHLVKRHLSHPDLTEVSEDPYADFGILATHDLTFSGADTDYVTGINIWTKNFDFLRVSGGPFTIYIDSVLNTPGLVMVEGEYTREEVTVGSVQQLVVVSDAAGSLTIRELRD